MVIFLMGKGFRETTSWTVGDGILNSVILYGPWAFRGMTFCTGGEAIVVLMIGNDG